MSDAQNIQWFPGHMTRTRRQIEAQLKIIDAVAEIVDARIPVSSRNPDLAGIIADKPHLILLNKCDMADEKATAEWISYYAKQKIPAIAVDCRSGKGLSNFKDAVKNLLSDKLRGYAEKGMVGKPLRVMTVGIPNVGKSSFINRIAGNSRAKVENRPGVTRGNQWFTVDRQLELLDTPGVLWPKFEDKIVGERLAFTGAVSDRVVDVEWLAMRLLEILARDYPQMLVSRYGIDELDEDSYELLCRIGKKRGMVIRGGETDTERAANMVLEEYRNCKIGRITLERAGENA
ncbi:MAG: ribosome biogenesis GTPase YlqF [Ruminococcaceae bacterium]|nr:ribosome biogenesis GTPase YlqF [Oscillospiraceae bacterium]